MSGKTEAINALLARLSAENCNQVRADNGMDEMFGRGKLFSVICNKCGGLDVEIIGERGIDYGGETGYQSGSTAIKCNGCGSALTIWG